MSEFDVKIYRIPISPGIKFSDYNLNNLHDYDPYMIVNDEVVIDLTWWNSLTAYCQNTINSKIKFKLGTICVPHEIQTDYDINPDGKLCKDRSFFL